MWVIFAKWFILDGYKSRRLCNRFLPAKLNLKEDLKIKQISKKKNISNKEKLTLKFPKFRTLLNLLPLFNCHWMSHIASIKKVTNKHDRKKKLRYKNLRIVYKYYVTTVITSGKNIIISFIYIRVCYGMKNFFHIEQFFILVFYRRYWNKVSTYTF